MLLSGSKRANGVPTAAMFLSLVIPAQHEMAGAFLCLVLFSGALLRGYLKLPVRQWVLCLAAAASSLAVVLASPGLHLRAAAEGKTLWDIGHGLSYGKHAADLGISWLLNSTMLLVALWTLLFAGSGDTERSANQPTHPGFVCSHASLGWVSCC
jgi:hypothetical protein